MPIHKIIIFTEKSTHPYYKPLPHPHKQPLTTIHYKRRE